MNQEFFIPRRKSVFNYLSITSILIILNLILFIGFFIIQLIWFKNNPLFLYDLVAIKPSNILSGGYLWTFLTSMFMHGGFFHLFANLFTLFFIGGLIEKIIGRKRYIWFYLISGVFASFLFVLTSYIFQMDVDTYAVGASGAIFGLIGLLVLLTPDLPVYIMFIPIPVKMKYAAPGILLLLWVISIAANLPIGNIAHLGGLMAGLAYGIYLKTKYKNKTQQVRRMFSK